MREMKLQDLKAQTPAELVSFAEEKGVENASTMRKQELMFAYSQAARDPGNRYHRRRRRRGSLRRLRILALAGRQLLPGRTISTFAVADPRFGLRTGDTIEGHIAARRKANAISRC
jgi:transcription termination factor Rho